MFAEILIKKNDLLAEMYSLGFKIGYEILTRDIIEYYDTIIFNKGNILVTAKFQRGILKSIKQNVVYGNGDVKLSNTSVADFYAELDEIASMGEDVAPSALLVFEGILFESYTNNSEKASAFISKYKELSFELQELFKCEYESLQLKQTPAVTYKQFDFFKKNGEDSIFFVNDVVGNQYSISRLFEIGGNCITDIRELTGGQYQQVPITQILGDYVDGTKRVLSALEFIFDPDWAKEHYNVEIPESQVPRCEQHAVRMEVDTSLQREDFCVVMNENSHVVLCMDSMNSYMVVRDCAREGRSKEEDYFKLMEHLGNNRTTICELLSSFCELFAPILHHLGLLDYVISISNAYVCSETGLFSRRGITAAKSFD